MLTCASLFSGGGMADSGLRDAGYLPQWGIEIDPVAADCYEANLGAHVIRQSVADVDPTTLEPVDLLWASPPCPGFSIARSRSLGAHGTEQLGLEVLRYVTTLRPRIVLLENVPPYQHAPVFHELRAALMQLGYIVDWHIVNAADHGVPQTRSRLILRAVRGSLLPPLPPKIAWIGWYATIEDLLGTLPETSFAPWQLRRLPAACDTSFLVSGTDALARAPTQPCVTITAAMQAKTAVPRAFIVSGVDHVKNCPNTRLTRREEQDPVFTITVSSGKHPPRAALSTGRVVAMTPRALARFQSVPDSYQLPEKRIDACRVIGNGVPPLLVRRLAAQLTELVG